MDSNAILTTGLVIFYVFFLLFLLARLGRFAQYAKDINASIDALNSTLNKVITHHNNLCGVVDELIKNNSSELSDPSKDGTEYSRRN